MQRRHLRQKLSLPVPVLDTHLEFHLLLPTEGPASVSHRLLPPRLLLPPLVVVVAAAALFLLLSNTNTVFPGGSDSCK